MRGGRWRPSWCSRIWLVVSLLGCSEQHDVDVGPDVAAPDAGPPPLRCGPLAAPTTPFACTASSCGVVRDEVVVSFARPAPIGLGFDGLGRPVTAVAVGGTARPTRTYVAVRDGAFFSPDLEPDVHDPDSPWSLRALGDEGYGALIAPGVTADETPCALALEAATDPSRRGPHTVRWVEQIGERTRELATEPGTLGGELGLGESGAFATFANGRTRLGAWRDGWRVAALEEATVAGVAPEGDGALVAWIGRIGTQAWLRVAEVDAALPRELTEAENLRVVEPAIRRDGGTRLPVARVEVAVREGASTDVAILVTDPSGSLHLHRRDTRGWRHDVLGVGAGLDCGLPRSDVTCRGTEAAHSGYDVAIDAAGTVVVLVRHTVTELALTMVDPSTFEEHVWRDEPPPPPYWLATETTPIVDGAEVWVAPSGEAPRALVASPLADALPIEDGALALGDDGVLHLLVRTPDAPGTARVRYLVLAPR